MTRAIHGRAGQGSGHANNFDFIRWLAASLVILSHEYALVAHAGPEPLAMLTGGFTTLGTLGVDIFFVVSGYLVTQSLIERRRLSLFVASRALRIVPGLAVALLVTVLLLGPVFTTLPLRDYLDDPATHGYLLHNLDLVTGAPQWKLPGLFAANPFPDTVNGSLWSLWPEVRLYAGLLVLGLLARMVPRRPEAVVGIGMAMIGIAGWMGYGDLAGHSLEPGTMARLAPYFAAGVLGYLLRKRFPHASGTFVVLWGATVLARGSLLFVPLFTMALAATVLWIAQARLGRLAQ